MMVCQGWVAAVCATRRTGQAFRIFQAFVCLESVALFSISLLFSYKTYFYSYYAGMLIEATLLVAAGAEILRAVYGPSESLPKEIPLKTVLSLGGIVATTGA